MIKDYTSTLSSLTWLSEKTFIVKLQLNEDIEFQAGQFVNIILPSKVARAYSIASSPSKKREIELFCGYYEGGKASEFFKSLKIGDEVRFKSPFGRFVFKSDNVANTIFVGTGTGIAPIKCIIDDLYERNQKSSNMYVFEGFRKYVDVGYEEEFKKYEEAHFLKYQLWCSREEPSYTGNKGRVTDGLVKLDVDYSNTSVYICGNKEVVLSLKEFFEKKGVPTSRIYFERFN